MRKSKLKYFNRLSKISEKLTNLESPDKSSLDIEEESVDEEDKSRLSRIKEQDRLSEEKSLESAEETEPLKDSSEKDLEQEEDVYSFEIKEGKQVNSDNFYTMLNNLISTIGPVRYPFAASLEQISKQINMYQQRSYSNINEIINFIENNSDVNVPVNNSISEDSKYIFNNYQGFKNIFYGNIDYLKGNKVDPKISGKKAVYVFGVQINTFSAFYNDYKKVASAFVSGSEAIRKRFAKSSGEKIGPENIKIFIENLYILKSLFENINNSSVKYSSNFQKANFQKTKKIKEIKDKENATKKKSKSKGDTEEKSDSNISIEGFVFDRSFGLIQRSGNSYSVDHETVSSKGDGFNFTLKLSSGAKGVDKDEVEKQIINKNLLVFSDMLSAEDSKGISESENVRVYVTLVTMEYLKVSKDKESDEISFKFTQPFAYLLEQGYSKEDYEESPFVRIIDSSIGGNIIINADKEKTYIEKIAESVSQTKYKVKVDGKNKNMSIAQIYMARQSGKKVKVLGMYSLSEDVKKWNPGKKK